MPTMNIRERASGKTTEIIIRMRENKELIALVSTNNPKKLYPVDLHNRVFTLQQVLDDELRGHRFSKLLIDEGFILPIEQTVQLYYYLGKNNINIEVYGTI